MSLTTDERVIVKNHLSFATLVLICLSPLCNAQGPVVASSVNGVLNPTQFTGNDIGAQINTAWLSGRTVRIPAGTYNFATTINHPGSGHKLECDAGTVLNYTGSADAITLEQTNAGGNQNAGIDGNGGCILQGTSAAQSGVHLYPSNHTFIRNLRITGFTNSSFGYGIYDTGGNSVEINNVSIYGNRTGVYLTGTPMYGTSFAANAVHIEDSDISSNSAWAVDSELNGCNCTTQNLGNVISNNVFEQNGLGDLRLNFDYGTSVTGNYFESGGVNVNIGETQNAWGTSVTHNYFTGSSAVTSSVTIGYGSFFNIEENALIGQPSTACFINVKTGENGIDGASLNKRGVGTNMMPAGVNEWCSHGTGTTNP
jgi:hypothetical protein